MSEPGTSACIFCEIIRGTQPALVIDQTEDAVVFLSLEGSPLVVPRVHVRDLYTLGDQVARGILPLAARVARAVKAGLHCDGVTLAQANDPAGGQDVFHFHLHVIPRWLNDGKSFAGGDTPLAESERAGWAVRLQAELR